MLRASAIAILCALALDAAATQLVAGPEVPIGLIELGVFPPWALRPSFATDGDRVLIAYPAGRINWRKSAFAVLVDREGRPLTPSPLSLAPAGKWSVTATPAVWAGGRYVVFFGAGEGVINAVQVTGDGEMTDRIAFRDLTTELPLVAASDGETIVVATRTKLLLFPADLSSSAVLTHAKSSVGVAVAFGGGRFAIVTVEQFRVTVRFLEGGTLTEPVVLSAANVTRGRAEVAWNGAAFVAGWTECGEKDCLSWLAPLARDGTAAALPRAVAREGRPYVAEGYGLTLAALDEETVFVALGGDLQKAQGRRFRDGTPLDEQWTDVGLGPVAAFRTAQGALMTADASVRVSLTDAAAVAPMPAAMPLTPAVRTTTDDKVIAAAASPSAIAILRGTSRAAYHQGDASITVMTRGGALLHELPVDAVSGALASDGRELFALLVDRQYRLVFSRVAPGANPVRLSTGSYPASTSLVWTGESFLAVWRDRDGIRMQRIAADGTAIGNLRTFGSGVVDAPRLTMSDGGLRLAWYDGKMGYQVVRLAADGSTIGVPEPLPAVNVVSNGRTDAALLRGDSSARDASLRITVRHDGGAFSPGLPLVTWNGWTAENDVADAVLAPLASGFLVAYEWWSGTRTELHAVRVDQRGLPVAEVVFDGGSRVSFDDLLLVPLSGDHVLAVYDRVEESAPHHGVARTYARILTTAPERRRAIR